MRKVPHKTGQIVYFEQQLGESNPRQKGVNKPAVSIDGILMTSSKSHVTQHTFYSLMLSNGADIVDRETGEKVIFDSPETLKFYKELAQYSPPGASGYDRPEAQAAMTTGKIAMLFTGVGSADR
jgi:ABC-type glycerol-3-phosphate transport system substrate-binding protein